MQQPANSRRRCHVHIKQNAVTNYANVLQILFHMQPITPIRIEFSLFNCFILIYRKPNEPYPSDKQCALNCQYLTHAAKYIKYIILTIFYRFARKIACDCYGNQLIADILNYLKNDHYNNWPWTCTRVVLLTYFLFSRMEMGNK